MQPERIAEIVEQIFELPAEQRAEAIIDLCRDDAGLRREVESLLGFEQKATDFIEQPAYEMAAGAMAHSDNELQPGDSVGQYHVISLVGEGGMGEVYLAEDTSLGRKVAVKLLKFGLGSANIIRHFHQEERILGGLTHPNIAQLYGADVTAGGLPYFVMEYVDGARLDDYCRDHQLSVSQKLELFRKVCAAVSYAHQHLVVHRDLKPANIRVTAEGEPKLLDFGIAKLLDPATPAMEQTMTFAAVMTPDYASPEQVRGENITTASDVYSLGVVLFELLTGRKPYQIERRTPTTIARAITEKEPLRPSTAIRESKFESRDPTDSRFSNYDSRSLRGDLDNIVMKALRKEPERRYASVGQFSEDIRRHLEGRPVIARKDTVSYRTAKFVGRNKVAVAAAVLILLASVAALIVSLWQAENARHERDVAERERLKAQRINTFLQDMLGAAAPEAKGYDIKVIDVLNEASRRARSEEAAQPEVMADVLVTLGRTYLSIGQYAPAVENLRAARDASLRANGELHPTTANAMAWLALGLAYQEQTAEGEPVSRKAIALHRELHPTGSGELGVALYSLGVNLIMKGDSKAAEPVLEEAVPLIKRYFGENHGYHMAVLTLLGVARQRLGKMDQAEALLRQSLELGTRVEPRYRIFIAQAGSYLGVLLRDKKNYAEAEKVLRECKNTYREVLGEGNSNVGEIAASLGGLYLVSGNYDKAEREFREAIEILPKFFPPEHNIVVSTNALLGLTLSRAGRPTEGEPLLRAALATRRKILPAGSPLIPLTESALGECLLGQTRYAEAKPLLVSGYDGLKAKLGENDARVVEAKQQLEKLPRPEN
jgi:serine/threonine protein kinase/tetratricopeptide (TPR) repeat protein